MNTFLFKTSITIFIRGPVRPSTLAMNQGNPGKEGVLLARVDPGLNPGLSLVFSPYWPPLLARVARVESTFFLSYRATERRASV